MNQKQVKDYLASYLLKQGVNKNSIIGILCNVYGESAFDCKVIEPMEPNGAQGVGLFQYSWAPTNANIMRYDKNHTDAEAIVYQANILLKNSPAQWIGGPSFSAFLHNTGKWSWRELTTMWTRYWERPYSWSIEGPKRQGYYSWIMPINWKAYEGKGGSAGGSGTNSADKNKPSHKDKKTPKTNDCMNVNSKGKGNNNNNKDNQPDATPKQGNTKLDMTKIKQLISDLQAKHLMYSMPYRSAILTTGKYSDCSAFVSYCVELGLNLTDRTLYSTESEHGFLEKNGFKLVANGTDKARPKKLQAGDVFILGAKGTSLGAGGHTAIMIGADEVAECSTGWAGGYPTGSDIYTHPFMTWWNVDKNAFPSNWHYYVYRKV